MNQRYNNAVAALQELARYDQRGFPATEAGAIAAMQTQAILAVAEEQAKTNTLLETANLIAFAQLCHTTRDGAAFIEAKAAVDLAMGATAPADEDEDL